MQYLPRRLFVESFQTKMMREFVDRKLSRCPEFTAALIVGSVAHGEARPDSDVDCILIFNKLNEAIVPSEFVWDPTSDTYHTIFEVEAVDINGIQIDANRVEVEDFLNQDWSEDLRHDLAHALFIYDRCDSVAPAINDRLAYPESLRLSRIQRHLSWAAYHLEEWRLLGWMNRGGLESAHDQVTAALEEIIQLLHAYNREWLPSRHRWVVSAQGLKWLPDEYSERVFDAISRVTPDKQNLLRRQSTLSLILDSIRDQLESESLLASPVEAFIANNPGLGYARNFDDWKKEHQKLMEQTSSQDLSDA